MATLTPAKYEKLDENIIVVGASVISLLKKNRYTTEDLFQILKKEKEINLEKFYNTLTFLWVTEIIVSDGFYVILKR